MDIWLRMEKWLQANKRLRGAIEVDCSKTEYRAIAYIKENLYEIGKGKTLVQAVEHCMLNIDGKENS